MDQEGKIPTEYDEINLMDYVRVIIKKKQMIFAVFLVVVIVVAVYSFFICPRVYKIDTIIEIGKIGDTLIEEPNQVVGKIETDVYSIETKVKLGIPEDEFPKIKSKNLNNTNLVEIKIEDNRVDLDKNVLAEINNLILAEHQEKIENKKELIEKDIERLNNKIALLEEEKNILEKKEKSLEWLSPYEYVKEQFTGSLFTLFDVREKLSTKKQEIENLYIQINSLQRALEDIQPTEVIKPPTVSNEPIKPRPALNIVIGAVLGIFLGVFFAFGKEWWGKELNPRS